MKKQTKKNAHQIAELHEFPVKNCISQIFVMPTLLVGIGVVAIFFNQLSTHSQIQKTLKTITFFSAFSFNI